MAKVHFDSHLSRLKEKFPDTPDTVILKADVLREGVRFNEDLAEIAQWAIPSNAFLSRENVPDGESIGTVLAAPNQMILEDDTRINTELDKNSPYSIRKEDDNRYALYRDEERMAGVSFAPRPAFTKTLSDGTPIFEYIGQRTENCLAVVHSLFCEYAKNRDQCSFCFLGNMMEGLSLADISSFIPTSQKKTMEACRLAAEEIDIRHVVVTGGALINTSLEAKSYARTIAGLREALGQKTRITAVCQAFDEEGWKLLKEAGADRVQPNLEVWADELWPEVVPGKYKALGKSEWLNRLEPAVDIFGPGQVATNFVAGSEMLPERGFDSLAEALQSHLEGYEFLISRSIVPIFGFLTKARGTRYESMELPPTEFYLELGWKRHRLMEDSGMYDYFPGGFDADFSCYQCVAHKTCQDYRRVLELEQPTQAA